MRQWLYLDHIYKETHRYARQMRFPKFAKKGDGFVFLELVLAQDRYQNLHFHFNVEFPVLSHMYVWNWHMVKNLQHWTSNVVSDFGYFISRELQPQTWGHSVGMLGPGGKMQPAGLSLAECRQRSQPQGPVCQWGTFAQWIYDFTNF